MSSTHRDHQSSLSSPARPELPQGWRYADEAEIQDDITAASRRRLVLGIAVPVVIVVAVLVLLVLNAQRHYSQGVEALEDGRYHDAVSELAAADLVVISYRDSALLADNARRQIRVETGGQQQAQARLEAVTASLAAATTAFENESIAEVVAALRSVPAADLRAVLSEDDASRQAAKALAVDITTEGRKALTRLEWSRAARYAAALLLVDPASVVAGEITTKAEAVQKLSSKLAEAKAAARDGEWRKALRLALAVQTAHKGFPGAASLVADARVALKPKPQPAAAAAVTAPAATTTTSGGTTTGGGGSSGGSTQPPPP